MSILVAAAVRSEVAALPPGLDVVVTGLGKTAAAIAVTRRLACMSDEELAALTVINVGTCGALRPGLRGVFEPGVVLNHEMNGDAIRQLGFDPHERLTLPHGDTDVVLATGDVFVADGQLRDRLGRSASLVDMEGYAVAAACRAFDVDVRLVKHVSDDADHNAVDWVTSVHASASDLGEWWRTNIQQA